MACDEHIRYVGHVRPVDENDKDRVISPDGLMMDSAINVILLHIHCKNGILMIVK